MWCWLWHPRCRQSLCSGYPPVIFIDIAGIDGVEEIRGLANRNYTLTIVDGQQKSQEQEAA